MCSHGYLKAASHQLDTTQAESGVRLMPAINGCHRRFVQYIEQSPASTYRFEIPSHRTVFRYAA